MSTTSVSAPARPQHPGAGRAPLDLAAADAVGEDDRREHRVEIDLGDRLVAGPRQQPVEAGALDVEQGLEALPVRRAEMRRGRHEVGGRDDAGHRAGHLVQEHLARADVGLELVDLSVCLLDPRRRDAHESQCGEADEERAGDVERRGDQAAPVGGGDRIGEQVCHGHRGSRRGEAARGPGWNRCAPQHQDRGDAVERERGHPQEWQRVHLQTEDARSAVAPAP